MGEELKEILVPLLARHKEYVAKWKERGGRTLALALSLPCCKGELEVPTPEKGERGAEMICYQCLQEVGYLFADSRGACCTRLTPEEVQGGAPSDRMRVEGPDGPELRGFYVDVTAGRLEPELRRGERAFHTIGGDTIVVKTGEE